MTTRKQRWENYRASLPLFSRFILSFTVNRLYELRNDYALRYITGSGYEIGAQNSPLMCTNADRIMYIDYLSRTESAQKYNIQENKCVEVDIIADANDLTCIPPDSASFIIANHVLEHCQNPVSTLQGWMRILRTKGILFLTLPNYKANEFDFEKSPTSVNHFIEDSRKASRGEDIATEHIKEHIQLIDGIDPYDKERFSRRYREIVASNLHTHYHVFDRKNVLELLHVIHRQAPIRIVNSFAYADSFELLFILEKAPTALHGPMRIRSDRVFNYAMLLKHGIPFLLRRILMGRQRR